MPRPLPKDPVEAERLRSAYALERGLADSLRRATAAERPAAYRRAYDLYFRALPATAEDAAQVDLQAALLAPWLDADTRLLDFGAGNGALARRVAPAVAEVVALEASYELVARARRRTDEASVRWVAAGDRMDDAPIEPGSIDVAFSCHVIEHLHPDDLASHLVSIRRWLRPGGRYLMATPSRLWGPHDVSAYFDDEPTGFHLREYTHAELGTALRRAGFADVRALRLDGRPRRLAPIALAERGLGLLPRHVRRRVLDRWARGRPEPLRPLEQVLLVGRVPR